MTTDILSTYTELKTEIQAGLEDTSNSRIVAKIPSFIFAVEQKLNRRFVPPAAWSRRTHTIDSTSANSRYLTLPPETVLVNRVHLDDKPYEPLSQLTPSALQRRYPYAETGEPKAFSVLGEVMELSHKPDQNYTVEIFSRQRIWMLGRDISKVDSAKYQSHIVALGNSTVEENYWTQFCFDVLLFGGLSLGFAKRKDFRQARFYKDEMIDAMTDFDTFVISKQQMADPAPQPPEGVMVV